MEDKFTYLEKENCMDTRMKPAFEQVGMLLTSAKTSQDTLIALQFQNSN